MTAENKVTSAKCQITSDNDAVIAEIEIAAPPDRVFQAIVDREQALQWAGGEDFEVTQWDLEPLVGGKWRLVSRERKGKVPVRYSIITGKSLRSILRMFSNTRGSPTGIRIRTIARWSAGN